MAFRNTEHRDLPIELDNLLINTSFGITKWRRLKIGCEPKECKLQEILLIKSILCRNPCYITEKDFNKLEQKLIRLLNG